MKSTDARSVHFYSNCIEIFTKEINEYPANISDFEAYPTAA